MLLTIQEEREKHTGLADRSGGGWNDWDGGAAAIGRDERPPMFGARLRRLEFQWHPDSWRQLYLVQCEPERDGNSRFGRDHLIRQRYHSVHGGPDIQSERSRRGYHFRPDHELRQHGL